MKVQQLKLSNSKVSWLVLGNDYLPIAPIQEYIRFLEALERSPNTIRLYANNLKLYWDYLSHIQKEWDNVTLNDFAQFITWLRIHNPNIIHLNGEDSKRAESTVNIILSVVSCFYEFHDQIGNTKIELTHSTTVSSRRYKPLLHHISKRNAVRTRTIRLKEPKNLPRTIKQEQLKQMLAYCKSLRDKFLITLLYETGLRVGQALGLHHQDIRSWDNEIDIKPRTDNINGARIKGTMPYTVHVSQDLMGLYIEYLTTEYGNICSNYVFIQTKGNDQGKPLAYAAIRDLFLRLSKKLGIRVTPHMLRHTHATELLRAGWDAAFIQRRLGHASVQTTINTYAHLNNSDLKAAFNEYYRRTLS